MARWAGVTLLSTWMNGQAAGLLGVLFESGRAFLEDPGMVESTKIWTLIKFRIGPFTTINVFGFFFLATSDYSELRKYIGA